MIDWKWVVIMLIAIASFVAAAVMFDYTEDEQFIKKCEEKGGNPAIARTFRLCIGKNVVRIEINGNGS